IAQQCGEMVALHLGDMISLGGCEQHLLDTRALQQPRDNSAMPIAKAFQYRVHGVPRVLEYLATGQQRAKDVHKHHLSRIVTEMLAVKRHDYFGLIHFKALLHHCGQRAIGAALKVVWNIKRGEPHIGVFSERAGIEEAAGLQKVEPMLVARCPQILTIKLMRASGIFLARRSVMTM